MRATPHTSWPWPENAWRTGLGAGGRAEAAERPLGAAERPLVEVVLERELEDGLRLELELEERCFVATWSRFVRGPTPRAELNPTGATRPPRGPSEPRGPDRRRNCQS